MCLCWSTWGLERIGAMRNRMVWGAVAEVVAAAMLTGQTRAITDAEVMRVHKSALLIDTHNDIPNEEAGEDRKTPGFDIGLRSNKSHTDLPRLREGGVGAVFFVSYVAAHY